MMPCSLAKNRTACQRWLMSGHATAEWRYGHDSRGPAKHPQVITHDQHPGGGGSRSPAHASSTARRVLFSWTSENATMTSLIALARRFRLRRWRGCTRALTESKPSTASIPCFWDRASTRIEQRSTRGSGGCYRSAHGRCSRERPDASGSAFPC
jgi:hypothetical protein